MMSHPFVLALAVVLLAALHVTFAQALVLWLTAWATWRVMVWIWRCITQGGEMTTFRPPTQSELKASRRTYAKGEVSR
jgi:hypothetical protein